MSDKPFSIEERDDDMLICARDWMFGRRCIARRPKALSNDAWRPQAQSIVEILTAFHATQPTTPAPLGDIAEECCRENAAEHEPCGPYAELQDEVTSLQAELTDAREHIRKQADDIMTLGALCYDASDPPVAWKERNAIAERNRDLFRDEVKEQAAHIAKQNAKLVEARQVLGELLDAVDAHNSANDRIMVDPHATRRARTIHSTIKEDAP